MCKDNRSRMMELCHEKELILANTFVPIAWLCKKQGAISPSSSEAEVIALDATLRMEGIPCLTLWSKVLDVFTGSSQPDPSYSKPKARTAGDMSLTALVDYVPTNVKAPNTHARILILEDNDAVIKMCIKGRSPNMRHVARTHRVDLDWLFERIREDPGIQMQYVNTKQQLADIFTKSQFTAEQWNVLCNLAQLGPRVA